MRPTKKEIEALQEKQRNTGPQLLANQLIQVAIWDVDRREIGEHYLEEASELKGV